MSTHSASLHVVGGAVLVLDMLLSPDRTGPWKATSMDMVMLSAHSIDGKERTEEDMRALLQNAGLTRIMCKNLEGNPYYDVTMGHKS
jgi:hypothetical protein